tara:strand:- start:1137 stop:1712 length:576 start_codon:yes stop_codon:yes gene_type:complete
MTQCTLKLIVGLGNPDNHLLNTRHNVGFWFVDQLSNSFGKDFIFTKKFESEISEVDSDMNKVTIMKPLTYINDSGNPLLKYIKNRNINSHNILIVYDDLDLQIGQIKIKFSGGSGGHNGLNSIIEKIGTKDFWRLRVGIDKPQDREQTIEYVLGKPSPQEKEKIDKSIAQLIKEKNDILNGNFSKIMNRNK